MKRKSEAEGSEGPTSSKQINLEMANELVKEDAASERKMRSMESTETESSAKWNSIDSDEEEAYDRHFRRVDVLKEDDVEGEEQSTITRDDDIAITPFNLKNELEEGVYTKDGNFVWNKKDDEEIRDSWLDNIDWQQVESGEKIRRKQINLDDQEDVKQTEYDENKCFAQMLLLMRPGESVAKALRRLGNSSNSKDNKQAKKMTTAERWKQKRLEREGKLGSNTENKKESASDNKETEMNKANLIRLTELADTILTRSGHMEVYEETYEGIAFKVGRQHTKIDEDDTMDEDEALDKFMETAKANEEVKEGLKKQDDSLPNTLNISNEVKWEYRVAGATDVKGPFASEKMIEIQEELLEKKQNFEVKKIGDDAWKDGRRIDFDLYT